jgi:hypothetical protein
MPVPAMTQAINAPATPVSAAKRRGREKTPAPTMPPTTIIVRVSTPTLAAGASSMGGFVVVSPVMSAQPAQHGVHQPCGATDQRW